MSKKIISIIMLMTMLLSVMLTACSSDDDSTTETASTLKKSIYMTIYGIKEDGMTDEAILAVQDQINEITENKYKTSIVLKLFTEDEYDAAIEKAIEEIEIAEREAKEAKDAAKLASKIAKEAAKKLTADERKEKQAALRLYTKAEEARLAKLAEEEAALAEDGLFVEDKELKEQAQLDILLIRGKDGYFSSINNGSSYNINSELNNYRKLTKYVNHVIIGAAKVMGKTHGIPVNRAVGTPQYYVVNKALAEKYQLELEPYNSLAKADAFLASVKANEAGVVAMVGPADIQSFDFFDDKPGHAIAARNFELSETDFLQTEFTYNSNMFLSHVQRMADYRRNGYFAEGEFDYATDDFALAVIKGNEKYITSLLGERSDEYMLIPYKKPRATSTDIFERVWAVSTKSSNKSRAVEMISAFMTDAELQNLFAFGIENVHYVTNADNTVTKLNNDWDMDYFNTFNTLIGYIPEELGADYQNSAKEQNINLKSGAFLGFNAVYTDNMKMLFNVVDETIDDNLVYELMNGDLNWQSKITNLLAKFNMSVSFDSVEDVSDSEMLEDMENAGNQPEDTEGEEDTEDEEDTLVILPPEEALPSLLDKVEVMFNNYKRYRFIADFVINNDVTNKEVSSTEEIAEGEETTQTQDNAENTDESAA